jgi:DDE superfamily endonuclease
LWHEGTERPIHRPTDPEEQHEYDRGKQKCHPLNNLLVRTETCQVCFWSHTSEGKASDKSLAELSGYALPPCRGWYQEKGFQGFCLEENSRPLSKRRIVGCPPSESVVNTRLVG